MALVLLLFSVIMGEASITPPLFIRSARIAFVLFAILCTAGVFASLKRGDVR
jgi:hypothetical protein